MITPSKRYEPHHGMIWDSEKSQHLGMIRGAARLNSYIDAINALKHQLATIHANAAESVD
jgi:hypothetical protein